MKSFKGMNNIKYPILLGPVISVFLFVTILTTFPITIALDTDISKQPVAVTLSKNQPASISVKPASPSTPTKATAAKVSNPSLATLTKQRQSLQSHTQPSRSLSLSASRSTGTYSKSSSIPSKASAVISTSKQYIGVNYVYGGTTPAGFDCSGFVRYVFAQNGISLPRVSRDQFRVGTSVSRSNLQPGDLVFFSLAKNGVVDHEGIYVGNNQFINASSSKGVTIYTLGPYWQSAYVGAKRVF